MGYLNSYYIGNVLLVLIYPIHKMLNLNSSILSREDTFGFTYENSILYTTLTLLALNYIRSYSMPQFVSETVPHCLLSCCYSKSWCFASTPSWG